MRSKLEEINKSIALVYLFILLLKPVAKYFHVSLFIFLIFTEERISALTGVNHLTPTLEHMICCMQQVFSLLKRRGVYDTTFFFIYTSHY